MELHSTAQPLMGDSHRGQAFTNSSPPPMSMGSQPTFVAANAPPAAYVPEDEINDHILRPNASNVQEIVQRVNGPSFSESADCLTNVACCMLSGCGIFTLCCGGLFRTGVGQIDLWLDSQKRPFALEPNTWQWRPNCLQSKLGTYDMSSSEPFASQGVAVTKVEAGSVYFAHQGGQPVMIAAKERAGWFATCEPGFSFANQIVVDGMNVYGCRAKLSSSYISFESLHLFNVFPNTVHVVSKYTPGIGNQWQVLPPGSHSFSSPFMKSTAVIPTSIQDVIICEDRVSTQDGIGLSNCKAVLSYQIRPENVKKLLDLDVAKYRSVIEDWAKRTMLHEIGNTDYQSHTPMHVGEADQLGSSPPPSSGGSVLGGRGGGGLPGTANRTIGHSNEDDSNFRPQLEYHMRKSLEKSLNPYGVDVITFAIQSFDPPAALAAQVTAALARRTEAQYTFQAAQIQNQTILAAAETEATAIRTRAAAVAKAAALTASVPHAKQLQILDKQVEIAKAWTCGNARTLVLQGGTGTGSGAGGAFPFASIQEIAKAQEEQRD